MAEAVVSFVVERLGDLLIQKASSLRNVSKNVERLQSELIHMQGFLKEADAWPHRDNRITQNLVAEIKDLAHDAEDVIESHAFAARKSTLRRMLNKWSVASEIDEFTSRINELGRKLQTYGIIRVTGDRSETQQNSLHPLRRTYSHIAEQHDVIGLDQDAETIATKLIDGTLRSRTVSICGMGGIGKTTLAKKVYHNTRVRRHFRCFAWVCVSQHHKVVVIWERILVNLLSPSGRKRWYYSVLNEDEMAKELYQLLMNEKCLVVLDDIWTKEAWECLCAGFPEANTHSKILLTTRNKDVALHVDPECFIHSPRCLNESQSWELFLSVAIHHREEGFTFDENLEELGRKIVNRCGGLPLAIKAFGGNLRTKSSNIHDWTMVYNNMLSHLSGIDNGMTELGVISLLALSYHDLPYPLKHCFLHFSHFPEDFIIPANTIINIWVAEGIIPKGNIGEEPMIEVEDIGHAYLEDLASRCVIQVEKWSPTGQIKSCRLHDLMRDLCIQEAKKENFSHARHLEDGNNEASTQSTSNGKFRRLVLYMKKSSRDLWLNHERYAHIRSLLWFSINMNQLMIDDSQLVSMAKHLKYLRLLYLNDVKVICPKLPKEIGDLVHLRLLDIGSSLVEELPSSLGKLIRLLTLKLDHVDLMSTGCIVPNILENMHELRNLYLPPRILCFESRDIKLSHLRNLQTLVNFPLGYGKVEDIVGLPNLRKLKLISLNSYDFKCLVEMLDISPYTTFNKLQSLSVSFGSWRIEAIEITKVAATCPHLHKLKLSGPLVLDLPERSQIFCQLNKLQLYYSNFVEDPMPHLGKLPNLRVLRLHSALKRDAIKFPKNSFLCLQSLVLSQEEHLKEWIIEEGALPRLGFLQLYFCVNLKTLPEGLKFLDSLQELQISNMPPAFTERIKRGGEDFHKIENVPSILLEINLEK